MHFSKLNVDDVEYQRITRNMRTTIMAHKFVRLSDFSIREMIRIENPLLLERYTRAKERIYRENGGIYNEVEYFHGSPYAIEIAVSGFNEEHSKNSNMFGKGVYFTKHASKANQYSWGANTGCPPHDDRNCTICPRFIIVCSCLMGKKFYTTKKLLKEIPQGYHSVIAEPNAVAGLKYAEYILRNGDQALPTVLVVYNAIKYDEA